MLSARDRAKYNTDCDGNTKCNRHRCDRYDGPPLYFCSVFTARLVYSSCKPTVRIFS